jgi:hypothetical protein
MPSLKERILRNFSNASDFNGHYDPKHFKLTLTAEPSDYAIMLYICKNKSIYSILSENWFYE